MYTFPCHEINFEKKKNKQKKKNAAHLKETKKMWFLFYIGMNPHFQSIQYSDVLIRNKQQLYFHLILTKSFIYKEI